MAYRDGHRVCPRCSVDLTHDNDQWTCETCRGTLVRDTRGGALDALEWTKRTDATPMGCPACGEKMQALSIMGVDVERCQRDSLIWFDGGELGFLRAYLVTDESPR